MHETVVPARCASMAFASPDGLNPEAHQHRISLHLQGTHQFGGGLSRRLG